MKNPHLERNPSEDTVIWVSSQTRDLKEESRIMTAEEIQKAWESEALLEKGSS